MTERFVLIGGRLVDSPSPHMMKAAFEAAGLDAIYETMEVGSAGLGEAFGKLKSSGVSGLNVTIPHKVSIPGLLDSLDDFSRKIGAVNTVKHEGSGYTGYNTDVDGVREPLRAKRLTGIRRAVVLGTGGASRAACSALGRLGCEELTVISRDVAKASGFLSSMKAALPEARIELVPIGTPPRERPEVVFNASPMGTAGVPLSPYALRLLAGRPVVFDAVYYPVATELITRAKDGGCAVIYGHEMLLHQAARAFEIWTGLSPPMDVMRAALFERLGVAA